MDDEFRAEEKTLLDDYQMDQASFDPEPEPEPKPKPLIDISNRKRDLFDDDDDDDEQDKDPADHSGAGLFDKFGDYENDNAHSRDSFEKPMRNHKNSFTSSDALEKNGKSHDNDHTSNARAQSSSFKSDVKDSIKIISTPLGKVSIIYQSNTNNSSKTDGKSKSTDPSNDMNKFRGLINPHNNTNVDNNIDDNNVFKNLNNNNNKTKTNNNNNNNNPNLNNNYTYNLDKISKTNTTYKANNNGNYNNIGAKQIGSGNSDSDNIHGNRTIHRHRQHFHQHHSSHQHNSDTLSRDRSVHDKSKPSPKQITPVLTADGKVALLYRGEQDAAKNQQKIASDKSGSSGSETNLSTHDNANAGKLNYDVVGEVDPKVTEKLLNEKSDNQTSKIIEKLAVIVAAETTTTTARTKLTTFTTPANTEKPILKLFKSDESSSRSAYEDESPILPNINRPPSEVLGIRKNQFTHFRITDLMATATPTLSNQDMMGKPPPMMPKSNDILTFINSFEQSTHNTIGGAGGGGGTGGSNGGQPPNFDYDYYNGNTANNNFNGNPYENPSVEMPSHGFDDSTTISDALAKAEVVNLAIIPAFEDDLHRFHEHQQQQNDFSIENIPYSNIADGDASDDESIHKHRHHRAKDLSALHCAMQVLVAIAALATVFGMLGAYFKQRIMDQLTIMHW